MPCECCGDYNTSKRFCNFCDKLYFKEQRLRTVKREIPKKVVKRLDKKSCEKCSNTYQPKNPKQKCCTPCKPAKLTYAEKWLNSKPKVNIMDSDQVGYSFFRKKYGVSKRFNACRG